MAEAGAGGGSTTDEEQVGVQFTIDGLCSSKHNRIRALDASQLSPATLANTTKEELCLEYVDNFQKQFADLFPARKTPFLVARNEAGVEKFLPTTLRCSQLPYKELYGLQECATFTSHYILYEPLDNPLRVPEVIPSPAVVLSWRIGDSFDMAFVLCSFLLGNGYDAYVVVGKAPRWITLRDQRRTDCPYTPPTVGGELPQDEETADSGDSKLEEGASSKYVPADKGVPQSAFQKMMAKREAEKASKEKEKEVAREDDPEPPSDDLAGRRVHAWVLVRAGPREVEDHLFVEPSTGRVYPVTDSPYEAVDSVVNNRNCWVNMQAPGDEGANVAFDLENSDNWEFVFIQTGADKRNSAAEGKDGGLDDHKDDDGGDIDLSAALNTTLNMGPTGGEEEEDADTTHVLDLPPSWVPKLSIPRDSYEERYGELFCSVTLYRKSKLELYAPDTHPRGLLARYYTYSDFERTKLLQQVEVFQKRADQLRKRVRTPLQRRVDEYFDGGRDHHLKRHSEILGKWRELEFYATAHIDGLVTRTEWIGEKIVETFRGRVDRLTYRSVSLLPRGAGQSRGGRTPGGSASKMGQFVLHLEPGDLAMRKMTQKFSRDPSIDADADVAKRTYFVQDKTIREIYHFAEGRIMASSRLYHKEAPDGQHVELLSVNPFATKPKLSELDADFRKVIAEEKDCSHAIREATRLASDILWSRQQDELDIAVNPSIFDTAREKSAEDASKEAEEEQKAENTKETKADLLKPFLANCKDPNHPTKEEAAAADKECRKALKERLIERVNIIQRRLDDENSKLAKKQAAFQRSQREQLGEGAEEEFEQFCAEAMFKIGILEQRLQRQEETVLTKFTELEMKLKMDPRLAVLYASDK